MVVSQTGGTEIRHERTGLVFRPGLEGVPATQSSICDIDGLQGHLSYRGYSLDDLAVHSSFLETTYLLIWGELPTPQQFRDFEHEVHLTPYPPLFGVQVGDFRNFLAAHRIKRGLEGAFPNALVVPADLLPERAFPTGFDCIRTP